MHRNMSTGKKLFNFKNTTFLWTWTLRSLATYASWCNTLASNKFPKSVKVLVFKELNDRISCADPEVRHRNMEECAYLTV